MLTALHPYASPAYSLIGLPGPASVSGRWCDGLEGFARSFLLAGWRIAGDPRAPASEALAERYARGLAAGTDPRHRERWPLLTEKAQAKVECASIALALHVTRALIWDRLDERVRERIVAWMAPMIGTVTPNNNWIWFQSLTEAFLRSVGGPFSEADLARNEELTESWYAGEGWYSDGDFGQGGNRNFDYYNGWAMHFYPLWYCRMTPEADDRVYRGRLRRYLADARQLIAADGAPLLHGRSATYRLAMLAPFWMGEICDATPLTPGETRRAADGVLKHFIDHGALDDDILRLGWHRAHWPIEPVNAADPRRSHAGPLVTCASVLRGAIEVRMVRIEGGDPAADDPAYPPHPGPWRLRIGGAALAADVPLTYETEGPRALVRRADDRLVSAVVGLRGLSHGGVASRTGTNAMGEYSACPWAISAEPVAAGDVLAAAVILGRDPAIHEAAAIAISPAPDRVTVRWPDGEEDVVHWGEQIR
jgi:hypothetical protein